MKRWFAAFALTLGVACAGQAAKDNMKALRESVNAYNTAFRWKNFHQAAAYLPNDLRTAFVTYFDEESSSLHVEAVEVLKVDVPKDDEAVVTVRYRYMLLPSVVIDRKVVTQTWQRKDDRWLLAGEEPMLIDYTQPREDETAPSRDEGWSTPDSWNRDG